MSNTQSQQFKFTEAVISADRLFRTKFDVRTQIAELNIFETLDKPYLTGQIVINDDKGIFDKINFQGTERIKITCATVDKSLTPVFEREFIMSGIEKVTKANENGKGSVYVFNLIEEHAFTARAKKISRSFRGTIDKILTKLIAKEMKKDIDLSYLSAQEAVQGGITGIIPNMTVMDALHWLVNRATTENGSPYFCYASMHDDNIRLGDLDKMLTQTPFNSKLPYVYNPANVATQEDAGERQKSFTIAGMKTARLGNTLKLAEMGLTGASYCNTNLNTGLTFMEHYSLTNTLDKLDTQEVIAKGTEQNVYDDDFLLNGQPLGDLEGRRFHTINSTGTYGREKAYSDEFLEHKFIHKVEAPALKSALMKNQFNVVVPGVGFIVSKASVGDLVRLRIINDNTETGKAENADTLLDKNKSGDFLIFDTRHIFRDTTHNVSMNVVKLARES